MTTPTVPTVTEELVAELEAAANAATPGPWNYDGSYVCTMRQEDGTTYVESWNPIADALLTKNVLYIATANPATILALLAERADLKRALADADAAHMMYADQVVELHRDAERLDFLQEQAKAKDNQRFGLSLQWLPTCEGEPSGYRYMHRKFATDQRKTLREAIDAARAIADT